MRKKTVIFVALILCFCIIFHFHVEGLSASSAVVMKAETLNVLYEKDAHKKLSMASTTKIMTALLAVESGQLEQQVTVTKKMTAVEGTSMGLREGDVLTLGNIVKGMMLLSGNDAANAVAEFLGGTAENFATLMNEKAANIGMSDTNFVTASGLDDEEHYTTAYDMAILASYAMSNPEFRSLVSDYYGNVEYIVPEAGYTYKNHNRFLTMYDGACGIKTGFTKKSGRCLVTAVEKGGTTVVAVTLNAPDDWNDHIFLYDETLPKLTDLTVPDNITAVIRVTGGEKSSVTAKIASVSKITASDDENFAYEILTDRFLYAPVCTGEKVGEVRFYLNDKCVGSSDLFATESVERKISNKSGFINKFFNIFRR